MARVLIVEDDPTSRKMIVKMVEKLGHTVFASPNGKHAYECLTSDNGIKLLITDVVMPEMDGKALVKLVRSNRSLNALPIIMMSAVIGVEEISGLLEMGATFFVQKPFQLNEIKEYVEKSLKSHVDLHDGK